MATLNGQETSCVLLATPGPRALPEAQRVSSESEARKTGESVYTGTVRVVPSDRSPRIRKHRQFSLAADDNLTARMDAVRLRRCSTERVPEVEEASGELEDGHRLSVSATSAAERRGQEAVKHEQASVVEQLRVSEQSMTPLELPPPVLPVSDMTVHQDAPAPLIPERVFY